MAVLMLKVSGADMSWAHEVGLELRVLFSDFYQAVFRQTLHVLVFEAW
jgi:hypothetical protein